MKGLLLDLLQLHWKHEMFVSPTSSTNDQYLHVAADADVNAQTQAHAKYN